MADLDDTYGTRGQVDFAKQMAEYLLSQKGQQMNPGMAVLPGSWRYGVKDVVDALSGTQYRDIAGAQDKALTERQLNPGYKPPQPKTLWQRLTQGGIKDKVGTSQAPMIEPSKIGILSDAQNPTPADPYKDEVKKSENDELFSGKKKIDKASWDYAQYTNGFGTKAKHPGESIDTAEAHARFDNEWGKAQEAVDKFQPNLPSGTRAALTSLTFNSGEKWMGSGLGEAVKSGDENTIKDRFVQYNKAGGETNKGLVDRRNREVAWIGQGAEAPEGRMSLGRGTDAPPAPNAPVAPPAPQGQQVAEGPNGYTATPTARPLVTPPAKDMPGSYQGPVPPANPLESTDQLRARLLNAKPEDQSRILEDYMKRAQGKDYETSDGGKLVVTPTEGNGRPVATHIPGKDVPLGIAGMNLHMRQNPDGTLGLLLPGGQTKSFNSLTELNQFAAQLAAQSDTVQSVNKAQVEPITQAIHAGQAAVNEHQTLSSMEALVKSSNDISMGPTSKVFNEVKRGLANFLPGSAKGIAEADSIEKLNSLLASESTKGVAANRGTNFELQTFIKANPNLAQSKEGMLMMIDILKQEKMQQKDLGQIANKYKTKDPATWQARKEEYYHDNPIIIHRPIGNGKFEDITTKKIDSKEERDALPPGTKYIRPDGTIGTRP